MQVSNISKREGAISLWPNLQGQKLERQGSSHMLNTLDVWIRVDNCTWLSILINEAKCSHLTYTVCILTSSHTDSNPSCGF